MLDRASPELPAVSVVIPTLGGDSLGATIERLNAGSLVPKEILLCVPAEESQRALAFTDHDNVRVLVTHCRGQVAQRAVGFAHASSDLVLQLDDDIAVAPRCVELLAAAVKEHGPRCAVGPALRWSDSRESVYKPRLHPAVSRFYYWLLNGRSGYVSGAVTRAGTDMGVYPNAAHEACIEAEWLPGGCVLHMKPHLVLDNFFPFPGKAFSEDLIHSFHLRRRSVRLLVHPRAVVYIGPPDGARASARLFLRDLWVDFRARRYYVRLSSRSRIRMCWYYLALLVRRLKP